MTQHRLGVFDVGLIEEGLVTGDVVLGIASIFLDDCTHAEGAGGVGVTMRSAETLTHLSVELIVELSILTTFAEDEGHNKD